MPEKIVISFDDEKPERPEEKIIIDLKSEKKEKPEENILKASISTYYKGNQHLTGFEPGNLRYPEGLENGFRKIYTAKLNDTFLNSILLNNKFAIASSASGSVYFIDRTKGNMYSRHSLANESFEKTGIVTDNKVYLNSVKSIFGFEMSTEIIKEKKLYTSQDGFYIWSNLNKTGGNIIFLEYSPSGKTARIVSYGIVSENNELRDVKMSCDFMVAHHIFDSVIIYNEYIFVFFDDKIMKYNPGNDVFTEHTLKFSINADTDFILLDGKIYFNNRNNELFYFDTASEEIKFTGIKCLYVNSLCGFNDNIFIGVMNGWYLYKTGGVMVFSYEDVKENKIESVNQNILAVSNGNKIVFHNLKKFHEAEGFTITYGTMESDTVISARIGDEAVFVLTKNGLLEVFNNDKLNLLLD
jgi:hypothetical protein